jgi:dTDP-D-glucose 4,6-dehydratase
MKIKIAFLAICLSLAFIGIAANPQKPTGRSIMQQVKDRPDGDTRYSQMELTLVKKNGSKRERKVESWAMDVGKDVK